MPSTDTRLLAITRTPAPTLGGCELTFVSRAPIDVARALDQHQAYCAALRSLGVAVLTLPPNAALPDSVFVEDTAVVVGEVALLTNLGCTARQAEAAAMAPTLARFRRLHRMQPPAQLEGGDVLVVGRTVFVGQSTRTNAAGIAVLAALLAPHRYRVVPVAVSGCLHLKTACTALDDTTLLLNPDWIDTAPLHGFDLIPVADGEPWAANVLRLPRGLLVHAAFPHTAARIVARGYKVVPLDIGEFGKAEAGLTCMSLVLTTNDVQALAGL
jgi:dimethylargininase